MKIKVNLTEETIQGGLAAYCSWERLAQEGHEALFSKKPGERIVAFNVDSRGIEAIFQTDKAQDGKR